MNILKLSPILKKTMSTSIAKKVDFYYDVISPFSWFAFEVFTRYKNHWNIDLELCPTLLGGIMKDANNTPPMTIPAKARYLHGDVERCRTYFEVPVSHLEDPAVILQGSMVPMRFLTVIKMNFPQYLEEASRAFWMIRWNKDQDFTTPEALQEVCKVCKISDAESKLILEKLNSQEVKTALKKSVQDVLNCGAFGVPNTVIQKDGEKTLIFGSDRFPIIAQLLGEEWKGPNPNKSKL